MQSSGTEDSSSGTEDDSSSGSSSATSSDSETATANRAVTMKDLKIKPSHVCVPLTQAALRSVFGISTALPKGWDTPLPKPRHVAVEVEMADGEQGRQPMRFEQAKVTVGVTGGKRNGKPSMAGYLRQPSLVKALAVNGEP